LTGVSGSTGATGASGATGGTGATGATGLGLTELEWKEFESVNSSIQAYGSPYSPKLRCALSPTGQVFLAGVIKVKTEVAAGGILFTLPPAMRPEYQRAIVISGVLTTTNYNLIIKTDGEVETVSALKTTYDPSLSGANFELKG